MGLGHASRLVIVANDLKKSNNFEFKFSSFGESVNYIKRHGFKCEQVPPVEFIWGKKGEFSVKTNINKIPQWLTNLPVQINKEIKFIKKFSPKLIISDSRLSPLIAGKLLDVPKILIINQIKLLLSPRLREFKMARFFETCNGELMGGLWNLSDKILIPDLPPPYTISEDTINSVKAIKSKIRYVGFITPKNNDTNIDDLSKVKNLLELSDSKPIIFVHISGPKETRKPIILKILSACREQNSFQYIFSEGRADGKTQPKKIAKNIWYFEWCPIRDEIFHLSDVLMIRGGHTAISQAVQFGKPFVTIPIESHGEQLSNSKKVEKLGIGKMLDSTKISANSLKVVLTELTENSNYHKNASDLLKISDNLDGVQNIKQVIMSQI